MVNKRTKKYFHNYKPQISHIQLFISADKFKYNDNKIRVWKMNFYIEIRKSGHFNFFIKIDAFCFIFFN